MFCLHTDTSTLQWKQPNDVSNNVVNDVITDVVYAVADAESSLIVYLRTHRFSSVDLGWAKNRPLLFLIKLSENVCQYSLRVTRSLTQGYNILNLLNMILIKYSMRDVVLDILRDISNY